MLHVLQCIYYVQPHKEKSQVYSMISPPHTHLSTRRFAAAILPVQGYAALISLSSMDTIYTHTCPNSPPLILLVRHPLRSRPDSLGDRYRPLAALPRNPIRRRRSWSTPTVTTRRSRGYRGGGSCIVRSSSSRRGCRSGYHRGCNSRCSSGIGCSYSCSCNYVLPAGPALSPWRQRSAAGGQSGRCHYCTRSLGGLRRLQL